MEWTFMMVTEGSMLEEVCPIPSYLKMISSLADAGYVPHNQFSYQPLDMTKIRQWEYEAIGVIWVHKKAKSIEDLMEGIVSTKVIGNKIEIVYKVTDKTKSQP